MYLTRVILNPRRPAAQTYLNNPYATHAAVLQGLPAAPDGTPRGRPLWRIDRDDPHRPHLLTLTTDRPDYSHIIDEAGYPAWDEPTRTRPYQPLLDSLEPGQRYAFRLTASPTYSTPSPTTNPAEDERAKRPRGQRRPHTTARQQIDWLLERTSKIGITIPTATSGQPDLLLTARRVDRFTRTNDPADRKITLTSATYQGHLTITHPDPLRHTLTHGLGTAKGLGCGLLTIARTRSTHEPTAAP